MASAAVPVAEANGAARRRRGRRATGGGGVEGGDVSGGGGGGGGDDGGGGGGGSFGVGKAPPLSRLLTLLVAHLGARAGGRARAGEGGAVGGARERGLVLVRGCALCAHAGLCGRRVGRGAAGARTLRGPCGLSHPAPPRVPQGGLEPTPPADRASEVRRAALSRAAPSRSLKERAVAERAPCREPSRGVSRPWAPSSARASKSCCAPGDLHTRGSALRAPRRYAKRQGRCSNRNAPPICGTRHARQFVANLRWQVCIVESAASSQSRGITMRILNCAQHPI